MPKEIKDIKVQDVPSYQPGQRVRILATGELAEVLRVDEGGALALSGYACLTAATALEPVVG